MPDLYLIRHGIAADRGTYARDDDRPLTNEGHEKTQKIAQRFRALGLRFGLIQTSPLVRARQTAEILLQAGLSEQVEESLHLAPEGELEAWLKDWQQRYAEGAGSSESVAIVGHQPNLGYWAERLVWGQVKERFVVKKAGVMGLTLPLSSSPLGNSELFWLAPPRFIL